LPLWPPPNQPIKGKHTPELGPVAVMAAPKPDLKPLTAALGLSQTKPGSLFTGNLYAGDMRKGGISLAGPFLGAPHAAMLMEVLASRGVKKLIFQGWCGSVTEHVSIGDIVIPTGGIVDEGTSRHYGVAMGGVSHPSEDILTPMRDVLRREAVPFHEGRVWTTDGAFRETREKVIHFQKRNALAVEMEMACLFSVAAFLGIDVGGILVVSDELFSLKWNPGFRSDVFKQGRRRAVGVVGKLCRVLADG